MDYCSDVGKQRGAFLCGRSIAWEECNGCIEKEAKDKEKKESGGEYRMIFYFSGTGNSRYVAEQVAGATKEEMVCITKQEMNKKKHYILQEGEKLGFVFPIYWWGMPQLVEEFIQTMEVQLNEKCYVYGVATYGLEAHNGLKDLEKVLLKKGITLQASFEVQMLDNYVVAYDMADKEKQDRICRNAEGKIEDIVRDIIQQKQSRVTDFIGTTVKPIVHSFYKNTDHRKKFYTTEACTGCGLCAKECPCQAIALEDGKPVWKENCSFCLKCIHSCPARALQHGKGTITRSRYLNSMKNLD